MKYAQFNNAYNVYEMLIKAWINTLNETSKTASKTP
jgi:hypothetical protein